jgi:uncharacterized membrane protein YbhN (UPF0104 family)
MSRTRLIRIAQPIVLLVALVFIGLLLRSQWDELQEHTWQILPGWLALSGMFMISSWFLEVSIWQRTMRRVGGELSYEQSVRIWFASMLVRYIPGNVWQPLGMTVLAQEAGVRPGITLTSIALYQAIHLLSIAPIAAAYLILTRNVGVLNLYLENAALPLAVVGVIPVAAFVINPPWLVRAINFALTRMGREAITSSLGRSALLSLMLRALVNWSLWGGAFAALLFAFQPMTLSARIDLLPHLMAGYAMGYAIGFLSFLTPGGLAVREGALILLLTPVVGAVISVTAIAMRVWQVTWEVIVATSVAIFFRARRGRQVSQRPTAS